MPGKRDYYEVLGVAKSASADEIKRAYRKSAAANHPDRNRGDTAAEERFKEAAEAYDVLSNPEKRQAYDRFGHDAFTRGRGGAGGGAGFQDLNDIFGQFGDIFGDLFGGQMGGGGGRRGGGGPRPTQGDSLKTRLQLDLREAAFGCSKTVEMTRDELCDTCDGSGAKPGTTPARCDFCGGSGQVVQQQGFFRLQRPCHVCKGQGTIIRDRCADCTGTGRQPKRFSLDIKIPAGVDEGMQIVARGQGEPGEHGGPRGDLYCEVQIKKHPLFERDGSDLHCTVPISFSQAALGTEFEIPLLDGKHLLEIPAGTQPGEVLRLRGKGMPHYQTQRKGDLLVEVQVEVPRKLSGRQEELIRGLAEIEHKHVSPHRKSFLEKLKDLFVAGEESEEKK